MDSTNSDQVTLPRRRRRKGAAKPTEAQPEAEAGGVKVLEAEPEGGGKVSGFFRGLRARDCVKLR